MERMVKKILAFIFLSGCAALCLLGCSREKESKYQAPVTIAPTKKPKTSWEKAYYVDDFGDSTSESYLRGKFKGSFSNFITTNSNLTVYFCVDNDYSRKRDSDSFRIKLLEYDDYLVNFKGINPYDVTIKVKIGERKYTANASRLDENYIYIYREDGLFVPVLWGLETGKEIRFVIEESAYTTSTYRFSVDSSGLDGIEHSWGVD
ncbi:MAG: hypothetical protein Q4B07_07710 [Clostridia bacterium]|nr:hypothetical protein [Clostridia bacterium]